MQQVKNGGAKKALGLSGAAVSVTKSIITVIAATVTIVFLTFFMLLEGGSWVERVYSLVPEQSQPRWRRVGHDIYKTVGGYITGNVVISLIAGASMTIVLLIMGVPYAVALGLLVAFLDLIPLAGATIAGIIVSIVAFLHSVPAGIVVVVFVIVYQQLENHWLQPVIYGRTVQLSPLVVLISVLIGAELAGILGALAAIPVAGSLQVIVRDQLAMRRGRDRRPGAGDAPTGVGPAGPKDGPIGSCRPARSGRYSARGEADRGCRRSCHAVCCLCRTDGGPRAAEHAQRARIGRPFPAELDPRPARPRPAQAERAADGSRRRALEADGGRRLLRAHLRRRHGVLEADRPLLPPERLPYWSVGENLLWSSPNVDPAGALKLWMNSPEHRANILTARWREIGVSALHVADAPGVYHGLEVTIITTDFGVRR